MSTTTSTSATGPTGTASSSNAGAPHSDRAAATADSATAYPVPQIDGGALPFGRLLHAELRKTVNTRAGRWLLITIIAVTALALGLVMWFSREEGATFILLLQTAVLPQSVLLPVLGILTAASEWSQRTALVTFAQEPRRMRVMAAKVLAAISLALVVMVLTVVLAMAAHAVSAGTAGSGIDLEVAGHFYLAMVVMQLIYVLMGVAFGALFLNVPLAIASFFVLPVIMNVVTMTVAWAQERAAWIDQTVAAAPFMSAGAAPTAQNWQQLGLTSVWWVLIPLAIGLWRVARREVK